MIIGNVYKFKHSIDTPDLVYLGYNWSGNGFWHQFAKASSPLTVWSEILEDDLWMVEEIV